MRFTDTTDCVPVGFSERETGRYRGPRPAKAGAFVGPHERSICESLRGDGENFMNEQSEGIDGERIEIGKSNQYVSALEIRHRLKRMIWAPSEPLGRTNAGSLCRRVTRKRCVNLKELLRFRDLNTSCHWHARFLVKSVLDLQF